MSGDAPTETFAVPRPGQQVNKTSEVEIQPIVQRDELIGVDLELNALIQAMKPRSNIDPDLLLLFLHNPSILEQSMRENGLCATLSQPEERPPLPCRTAPNPVVIGQPGLLSSVEQQGLSAAYPRHQERSSVLPCRITSTPVVKVTSGSSPSSSDLGKIRKLINEYGHPSGGNVANCVNAHSQSVNGRVPIVTKDSDYSRRLVLEYGMAQENHNPQGYVKTIGTSPIQPKSQKQRPCAYFNMAKGCWRGSSCWFKHIKVNPEGSIWEVEEQKRAKRMKR